MFTMSSRMDDCISSASGTLTAIRPSDAVLKVLRQAHDEELKVFESEPDRAAGLLAIGETKRDETIDAARHAAMTVVTSIILNLDETLTRG